MSHLKCGLGDAAAALKVYIDKRPPLSEYTELRAVRGLQSGEISAIGKACGNGWRKVFNLYAKLAFALSNCSPLQLTRQPNLLTWQQYRDDHLLQEGSRTCLLFSAPFVDRDSSEDFPAVHIVMGRQYAQSMPLSDQLQWLDREFAVIPEKPMIVCPYFDYRQLSNQKLERLVTLVRARCSSTQDSRR